MGDKDRGMVSQAGINKLSEKGLSQIEKSL